jgi:protoheme IX farnesyltransferase
MNSRADVAVAPRDLVGALAPLVQLTKPGVTRLVMATTLAGAIIAPGAVAGARLVWALVGTVLVVASANTLNMYLEGDVDALMARTRNRPIPSGRLAPEVALWFGIALAVLGLPVLALGAGALTALVGAIALVSYVCAYTPLKRVSPLAVWVGAVPGAAPPLMGYTAMTGALDGPGLSLFLLLFVWQVPHFHAIAIFRQSEYVRAGLKVLPGVQGLDYTKLVIVTLLILQLCVSALPAFLGLGGILYAAVAACFGAVYLGWALYGLRPAAGARWARSLFFVSMPYLVAVYGALVADAL